MNNEAASYSTNSTIASVISDPSFKDYGRLMFPLESQYYSGNTLENLIFTWYDNVDPNKTIEIINYFKQNAEQLKVNMEDYSLWGGSAGGRMAAWLGTCGPASFSGNNLPRPSAIITQYTGLNEFIKNDPPTYACVGDKDGNAYWKTMQEILNRLYSLGVDIEFHVYEGLRYGFGLGTGTVAEGWINDAVAFWEKQMKE
ncbi:alpha/beta hydrolase [Catenibacterium sp.]|uniref:alpha/beta hydrolase n=1 Tax=Catenibacterium sp. TaxID=2049022 RepID=UPI003FD7F7BA